MKPPKSSSALEVFCAILMAIMTSVINAHYGCFYPHSVSPATCNGQLLVSVITKVLSGYHTNETKLAAAQR